MTLQSSVYKKQAVGIVGEFADNSPRRVAPYAVYGNSSDAVTATGTLTFAANVSADDTVTVGVQTYKFVASPTDAYDVDLGSDVATSIANLIAAVNLTGTEGVEYAAGTLKNISASASLVTGEDKILFTAIDDGTAGNAVVTTETGSNTSFGSDTLTGGAEAYAYEAKVASVFTQGSSVSKAVIGGTSKILGVLVAPKQYANSNYLEASNVVADGVTCDIASMGHIFVQPAHDVEVGYIGIYNATTGAISAAVNSGTIPAGYAQLPNSKYILLESSASSNGIAVLELRD